MTLLRETSLMKLKKVIRILKIIKKTITAYKSYCFSKIIKKY